MRVNERATIRVGSTQLHVLVARTPVAWSIGLMGEVPEDVAGMLFVMPAGSTVGFHMRGVEHALLIAAFDAEGALVDLGYLEPGPGTWRPRAPYTYALELVADRVGDPAALAGSLGGGLGWT